MKLIFFCILLAVAASADQFESFTQSSVDNKPYYDLKKSASLYVKYLADYKKEYKMVNDLLEHYDAFKNSLRRINNSNRLNPLAVYDINVFADMTESEYHLLK